MVSGLLVGGIADLAAIFACRGSCGVVLAPMNSGFRLVFRVPRAVGRDPRVGVRVA